jgi:stage II sporulation protein Q
MKKLKIKKHVLPVLVMAICLLTVVTSTVTLNLKKENKELLHLNYVSNTIISKDQAVINTTTKVISPYVDQSVQIGKNYYDYKGAQEDQEKAIIYHENTYIQNSGVDFMHDNQFEVISILDGTVINVREDTLLGKIVEIQHANDYISVYQSLGDVKVKKGDSISQGHIIGTSGTNSLDKNLGNHLHFELYIGGQVVNPMNYINKEVHSEVE